MEKIAEINGIDIYYIRSSKFKTGSINITFCDNLSKDRAYKNALIPSILARGCKTHPTQRDISAKLMSLYGAGFSTNVEKKGEIQLIQFVADFVEEVYAKNYKSLVRELVELLFNIICNPVTENNGFKKEYFQQERVNNNNIIRSLINNKQNYAIVRCQELMCQDEPFGINELGAVEDGDALTESELYKYYREYFLKRLPVKIFFCGRNKPDDLMEVLDSFKDEFAGEKIKLNLGYREFEAIERRDAVEKMDVTQGKLTIGFRTNVDPDSDDFYALCVANGIFGAGVHSKLFQNVREKNSLAYYAASRIERYKGLMVAYSGIEISNKEKAEELILKQLQEVRDGNVTENEYESTIRMFKNAFNSFKDTQFAIMDFFIGQTFLNTEILHLDDFIEKISSVTVEDAVRCAQKIQLDTVYFLTSNNMEGIES
ncbi:MAG: insulinase family protein [Clostridiaceae bacterium]|nr:insulinase family protein [Clostridiaceae bacterium]